MVIFITKSMVETRHYVKNKLYGSCQNPNSTTTQLNLNLSWVRPNLDETLKVGLWEHLEQIPTVTVTFVQVFVHIRNISAVTDTIWTKL